jgi:crossover junction endodeoxyribonuclease RuvC
VVILGLDPGSLHTGYALVEKEGPDIRVLDLGRISCSSRDPVAKRLGHLSAQVGSLVQRWHPETVALESLFHGLNSRSLIVLAQARGALLAALSRYEIEIREYSPAEVKTAVTGHGRADKQQVSRMVGLLVGLDGDWPEDATDALAVALCCAQRLRMDRLKAR